MLFVAQDIWIVCHFFSHCYWAGQWPTMGHLEGKNLTNLMLIIGFWTIWPKGHREPHNEFGQVKPSQVLSGAWTRNLSRGFSHWMIATQNFLSTMFCALQKDVWWMYDTLYECALHFFCPAKENFEKSTHFPTKNLPLPIKCPFQLSWTWVQTNFNPLTYSKVKCPYQSRTVYDWF